MDQKTVIRQLHDLPEPFKREGPNYNAFINSFAISLFATVDRTKSIGQQLDLNQAKGSWLNVWGSLFGLPRYPSETDAGYQARIKHTLLGWASTVAGIGVFLKEVYSLDVKIVEDFSSSSFQIQFSEPLTETSLTNIAEALNFIRPAGIPFLPFDMVSSGPFISTSGFLGMTQMTGAYLTGGTSGFQPAIPSSTPSVISKLPVDLLSFTDLTSTA